MLGVGVCLALVIITGMVFHSVRQQEAKKSIRTPEDNPAKTAAFMANKAILANKAIYLKAKEAARATTWEGAQILLDQIDKTDISDPDVASYVAISVEIADFCAKVGISRSADPSWSKIIEDIDPTSLAMQMISDPRGTIKTGLEIKKKLPLYDQLSEILKARYA